MKTTMQCKDIDEAPILALLSKFKTTNTIGTWYGDDDYMPENSIVPAFQQNTPKKLILAKMKSLIKNKKVSGCGCGCRGDFELI